MSDRQTLVADSPAQKRVETTRYGDFELPGLTPGEYDLRVRDCRGAETRLEGVLVPAGLMEAARGPVQDKIGGFGVDTLTAYLVLAAFYSLIHSLLEEYYWRWFVFAQLRRFTKLPAAISISSVGFMAHHVILLGAFFGWDSPLGWSLAVAVAAGGAVWAWMYQRWGSLYPLWFGHLLVDAGIFWIGYDLVGGLSS